MIKKLIPDPPVIPLHTVNDSLESRLSQASDLLRCASATAYESGDGLHGQQRDLAMASMHLISQAREVIDRLLDQLPPLKTGC